MRRLIAYPLAICAALAVGACESPTSTSSSSDVGAVVALDSLRIVDSQGVPCCAVDSAGGRVTILGGTLTFRRYAHFTDTAITPAPWPISAACVTGVPNGATIHQNWLVTVGDSVAFLMIPCHVGTYALALTERLDFANGSSRTANVTVSAGTYSWTVDTDTLSLVDEAGDSLPVSIVVDTVIVALPGHTYRLQAVAPGEGDGSAPYRSAGEARFVWRQT